MKQIPNKKTIMECEIKFVTNIVCRITGLKTEEIFSKSRERDIVRARHIIQYYINKYTSISLAKIGENTGGKDHSTILHSYKSIQNALDTKESKTTMICNILDAELAPFIIKEKLTVFRMEENMIMPSRKFRPLKYPIDELKLKGSILAIPVYDAREYRRLKDIIYHYGPKHNKKFSIRRIKDEVWVWRVK